VRRAARAGADVVERRWRRGPVLGTSSPCWTTSGTLDRGGAGAGGAAGGGRSLRRLRAPGIGGARGRPGGRRDTATVRAVLGAMNRPAGANVRARACAIRERRSRARTPISMSVIWHRRSGGVRAARNSQADQPAPLGWRAFFGRARGGSGPVAVAEEPIHSAPPLRRPPPDREPRAAAKRTSPAPGDDLRRARRRRLLAPALSQPPARAGGPPATRWFGTPGAWVKLENLQ
jgi:hypothetical protein